MEDDLPSDLSTSAIPSHPPNSLSFTMFFFDLHVQADIHPSKIVIFIARRADQTGNLGHTLELTCFLPRDMCKTRVDRDSG